MNTKKLKGVARTMIWTLRPRAEEHSRPDALFRDEKAAEWYSLVAQHEDTASWYSPAFQVAIAIRTRVLDDATLDFIGTHNAPLIVELGAGLSTRAYRIGTQQARWVALDLPDVIAIRRQLAPEADTYSTIACSVLECGWPDRLPEAVPQDTLFIAEGLFMFFSQTESRDLVRHMRGRFPGATLLLDVPGRIVRTGEARIAEEMGVPLKWMVNDEWDVAALGVKVVEVWPILRQYPERLWPLFGQTASRPEARNASLVIQAKLSHGEKMPDERPVEVQDIAETTPSQERDPAAIYFRGQPYTADKTFLRGTHRVCPPEQTLERIHPYFERVGITRLADITGLDRIGLPVALVLRPNSPTLSNSTGKGLTLEAAMASGAMESIEAYHAENMKPPELFLSYEQLRQEYPVIPPEYLPLTKEAIFSAHLPERWVVGWDLIEEREVAVPFQLVMLHSVEEVIGSIMNFQMGSNGLASCNHFLEALVAALCELVERDAATCHQLAWGVLGMPPPRVRLDTIEAPAVQELLEHYEAAQVQVLLFDVTNDVGIPTYQALLYDKVARGVGVSGGQGAHPDPEIAMLRALTEAAQSRVVGIAGSRDEHFRHSIMVAKKSDCASQIKSLEAIPATVDARRQRAGAAPTLEGDVHIILDRLKQVGLGQVIVFDLTLPGFDISVVRVIVPGLEGYKFNYYRPGPRAQTFLKQKRDLLRAASESVIRTGTADEAPLS
jgi:ribosomal protein S12 methylthiotransferase accessory factor